MFQMLNRSNKRSSNQRYTIRSHIDGSPRKRKKRDFAKEFDEFKQGLSSFSCTACRRNGSHYRNCYVAHWASGDENDLNKLKSMFEERHYADQRKYTETVISSAVEKVTNGRIVFNYDVACVDESNNCTKVPLCRECFQFIHNVTKYEIDKISNLLKSNGGYSGTSIDSAARKATTAAPAGKSYKMIYDAISNVIGNGPLFVNPELIRNAMMPLSDAKCIAICIMEQLINTICIALPS